MSTDLLVGAALGALAAFALCGATVLLMRLAEHAPVVVIVEPLTITQELDQLLAQGA